jgi:hypothetical protein
VNQVDLEQPRPTSSPEPSPGERLRSLGTSIRAYFSEQDPTFWVAFTPALLITALLFVRSPFSNYIFDEQEALLANPYVNAQSLGFWDAVRRDFWGLPPERSIGSYRPIPNLIWRSLWHVSTLPFFHHWINIIGHAANAALIASVTFGLTQRRKLAWLAGGCFATSAVLTEAVSGVVGIADVLGGLGVLAAVAALWLPLWSMPFAVLFALLFGLFSKESAIVGVPLVAWAALVSAPAFHRRPRRGLRLLLALAAAIGALVIYTEFRRHFFPVSLPSELLAPLPADTPPLRRALRAFLIWFQQPQLPNDPINNPLVQADTAHRIAGGLRVFVRGLGQVLFPWNLSGDYSFPQEPSPERLIFPESVLGALAMVGLPLAGIAAWVASLVFERRERHTLGGPSARLGVLWVLAIGAVWVPIAYFPHSNIPVLLPTVRAERFWYLPAVGTSLLIALGLWRALRGTGGDAPEHEDAAEPAKRNFGLAPRLVLVFFAVNALKARAHAFDYRDDLAFWSSTRQAAPNSAKAHLNYSVMVGARNRLDERLEANRRALDLAPTWAMAWIYYGDTLCRLKRIDEAWPHYKKGFELAPNDPNLVALSLQCLWDHGAIASRSDELLDLAARHPGSWLAFLASDIVYSGKEHGGVQKKYRPRSYDEGPRTE